MIGSETAVSTCSWKRDPDDGGRSLVALAASAYKGSGDLPFDVALAAVRSGFDHADVFSEGMIVIRWKTPPSPEVRRAYRRAADRLSANWIKVRSDLKHVIEVRS